MLYDPPPGRVDAQNIKLASFASLGLSFTGLLITREVPFWGAVMLLRGTPDGSMDWLSPPISALSDTATLKLRVNLVHKPGDSMREILNARPGKTAFTYEKREKMVLLTGHPDTQSTSHAYPSKYRCSIRQINSGAHQFAKALMTTKPVNKELRLSIRYALLSVLAYVSVARPPCVYWQTQALLGPQNRRCLLYP